MFIYIRLWCLLLFFYLVMFMRKKFWIVLSVGENICFWMRYVVWLRKIWVVLLLFLYCCIREGVNWVEIFRMLKIRKILMEFLFLWSFLKNRVLGKKFNWKKEVVMVLMFCIILLYGGRVFYFKWGCGVEGCCIKVDLWYDIIEGVEVLGVVMMLWFGVCFIFMMFLLCVWLWDVFGEVDIFLFWCIGCCWNMWLEFIFLCCGNMYFVFVCW